MASNEKLDIALNKLALEPMDDKVTAASAHGAPVSFHADTRSGKRTTPGCRPAPGNPVSGRPAIGPRPPPEKNMGTGQ